MKKIALVTYQDLRALSQSDQLLLEPLADYGIQPVAAAWDDPEIDWRQFDAIILRSCWDYHKRLAEFKQWIAKLIELNIPLYNSPQTVLWNMEKNYLRELVQYGIRTIPTFWVKKHEKLHLSDLLASQNLQRAVLKPTIGASAYGIHLVSNEDAEQHQQIFENLLTASDVMVQPVVEEIRNGELSLVFFLHNFSYAIRKMPGADTIFVNSAYGGSRLAVDIPQQIVKTASSILETANRLTGNKPYLYARVDGILVDDQFVLMELELIEPGLLLDVASPQAARHFASAIAEMVKKDI